MYVIIIKGDIVKKFILILSSILILIGELIKFIVINNMNLYDNISVIPNFLNITYVKNTGAAFSILEGNKYLFIGIAIIALLFFIRFIFLDKKISKFDVITYSLVISGIVGNLIDRIFRDGVIDYIHFNISNYDAPIFNFSDICIVIGAFMVLFILIIKGDSDENIYSRK